METRGACLMRHRPPLGIAIPGSSCVLHSVQCTPDYHLVFNLYLVAMVGYFSISIPVVVTGDRSQQFTLQYLCIAFHYIEVNIYIGCFYSALHSTTLCLKCNALPREAGRALQLDQWRLAGGQTFPKRPWNPAGNRHRCQETPWHGPCPRNLPWNPKNDNIWLWLSWQSLEHPLLKGLIWSWWEK